MVGQCLGGLDRGRAGLESCRGGLGAGCEGLATAHRSIRPVTGSCLIIQLGLCPWRAGVSGDAFAPEELDTIPTPAWQDDFKSIVLQASCNRRTKPVRPNPCAADTYDDAASLWLRTALIGDMRFIAAFRVLAVFAFAFSAVPAGAGDPPRLFDPNSRIARTDLSGLARLRFLTSLDFPPFNFADQTGRPAGFNVEIARAICAELDIAAKCEIQAMPWEELDGALDGMHGEAIIAGHGVTSRLRNERAVSLPYFRFPARFVARSDFAAANTDMYMLARERKVAVVAGSAHAAMLKDWFREAEAVDVDSEADARAALKDGSADLIFGDGVALSFWLASPDASGCCSFVSGPFLSTHFLGDGMVIVMRKDNEPVMDAINSALAALESKGIYREIYARHFPIDPFADGIGAEKEQELEPSEGQAESPDQSG